MSGIESETEAVEALAQDVVDVLQSIVEYVRVATDSDLHRLRPQRLYDLGRDVAALVSAMPEGASRIRAQNALNALEQLRQRHP